MTAEALEQLLFVLEVTPEPPAADADPIEVLESAQIMAVRRDEHVNALKEILGPDPLQSGADDSARDMLAEIRQRDERWHAAIARARRELGDRRAALSRIKRMARND